MEWVASLDDAMAAKLAAVGLIAPRASKERQTLGTFLDDYVQSRVDVGPATRTAWGQVIQNLNDHFGQDRDLSTIHEGDADGFKMFLISEQLSSTTVARRLQFARQFFRAAHRQRLCDSNPFADVRAKAIADPERQVFVARETVRDVLEACDPDWRLIVVLCRYAGLRCPSEVCSLKWQDINWAGDRMVIRSPKTAHHEGGASRIIPIFAEIRAELEAAFQRAPEGAVYVLEQFRSRAMVRGEWKNANLRTQFERIIRRAGVEPWPRLFHQLRASCETELVKRFPLHTVARWLGHTPKIAVSHYVQVTSEDFATAAALSPGGAESGAVVVQKAVQQCAAENRTSLQLSPQTPTPPRVRRGRAKDCVTVLKASVDRGGIEPAATMFEVPGVARKPFTACESPEPSRRRLRVYQAAGISRCPA